MIIFLLFVFKHIADFNGWSLDGRMVGLNRERTFHTGSVPMENCRRRQSSSTSVLLPTGSSGNGMTVQQELVPGRESCGRDIRITFTIQDTSLGPLKRGLGDDDFSNCSTTRKAVVSLTEVTPLKSEIRNLRGL
jgi:hypothetical protein